MDKNLGSIVKQQADAVSLPQEQKSQPSEYGKSVQEVQGKGESDQKRRTKLKLPSGFNSQQDLFNRLPSLPQQIFKNLAEESVENMNLHCLCGFYAGGPLLLFDHIRTKHAKDDLSKIFRQKQMKSIITRYPRMNKVDYLTIEGMDDRNWKAQISHISQFYDVNTYLPEVRAIQDKKQGVQFKGTYQDLSCKFIQWFQLKDGEKLMLLQFFWCLKHFVSRRFGLRYWYEEPPNQLLSLYNHIYHYFRAGRRLMGTKFGPLKVVHLRRLLYILGRWMMLNRWTVDRIVRIDGGDCDKNEEEEQQVKIQE